MFKIITLTFASLFVLITNAYAQSSELPDTVWTKFTYPNKINAVKFTPDGKFLATGGDDSIPRLWNAETGELVYQFPKQNHVILDIDITSSMFAFSSPGVNGIKVYNVQNYELYKTLYGSLDFQFSSDGKYLVTGSSNVGAGLTVFETDNWKIVQTINFDKPTNDLKISPNNQYVARAEDSYEINGNNEGKISIYSMPDLNFIKDIERRDYLYCPDLAFSPDGKYLAGAISSSPNKIWKTDDWSLFRECGDETYSVAFSHDNRFIVTGGGVFSNRHIYIWSMDDGKLVYTYPKSNLPNSLDISPDNRLIAASLMTSGIIVYNAKWNPTSVDESIKIPEPEIFPNPTNGNISIDLKENQFVESVRINDMKGVEVLNISKNNIIQTNTKITINLPNLDNGIYLLNLNTNHGIMSYKLIMEK